MCRRKTSKALLDGSLMLLLMPLTSKNWYVSQIFFLYFYRWRRWHQKNYSHPNFFLYFSVDTFLGYYFWCTSCVFWLKHTVQSLLLIYARKGIQHILKGLPLTCWHLRRDFASGIFFFGWTWSASQILGTKNQLDLPE